MEKGFTHIYCGDGKGKTTAATGLAVRAAGTGKTVLFVRFLKNDCSGELPSLARIPGIVVLNPKKSFGFYSTLSEDEKRECREVYRELWDTAVHTAVSEAYDMLVLDEFMAAYSYGMIGQEKALHFMKEKPEGLEVVLTGRNPSAEILALADYVSEIQKVKHPFDRGIAAREGIEY